MIGGEPLSGCQWMRHWFEHHWRRSEELPVVAPLVRATTGDGERVRGMSYAASEKLESEPLMRSPLGAIGSSTMASRTVEASHLPVRQTLAMLGIPSTTYYRRSDRWSEGGLDGLEDVAPHPGSVWNRLPDETRADVIEFALEHEELTPRELAVKYTDEKQYFVSESSVYQILKAEDLITAPAHIVMKGETLSGGQWMRHWFEHHWRRSEDNGRAMSSRTEQRGPTNSGRRTSPISRFWGGAGFTFRPPSTITAGTSSPGSSARR
jgi:hypothetical protein